MALFGPHWSLARAVALGIAMMMISGTVHPRPVPIR